MLEEIKNSPDYGLELQDWLKERLRAYDSREERPERKMLDEVMKQYNKE